MKIGFRKKSTVVPVIIISGSCCIPGMAAFDEQARLLVQQASHETGVTIEVKVIPATTAYFGAVPRAVMARLMTAFQSGRVGVPAILVDGSLVDLGLPELAKVKAALRQAAETRENGGDASERKTPAPHGSSR
ncbi:MAG TPA: hypothetical protein VGL40_07220 [Bacillota bacterium]|jgi:hypothetical protein